MDTLDTVVRTFVPLCRNKKRVSARETPTLPVGAENSYERPYETPLLFEEIKARGTGFDSTSIRTRAERDGNTYVVNGQKTWTSRIHALIGTADEGVYHVLDCLNEECVFIATEARGLTQVAIDRATEGANERCYRKSRLAHIPPVGDEMIRNYVGEHVLDLPQPY